MSIYSINQITAEAVAAAVLHSNVDNCCPYPLDSTAGHVFRQAFEAAVKLAEEPINQTSAHGITSSLEQFESLEGTPA